VSSNETVNVPGGGVAVAAEVGVDVDVWLASRVGVRVDVGVAVGVWLACGVGVGVGIGILGSTFVSVMMLSAGISTTN
jgi:hypothetical protein